MNISLHSLKILDNALEFVCTFEQFYCIQRCLGFPGLKYKFRQAHGYKLNLHNPMSHNEKLIAKSLFKRDQELVRIADKLKVRELVAENAPECCLIPLLGVFDAEKIPFDDLPENYILKTNFQSGTNRIVRSSLGERDKIQIKRFFANEMKKKYRFGKYAWWLQNIPRRLFAEFLLIDSHGLMPKDYKFHMFNGELELIQVYNEHSINTNGHGQGTCTLYDRNYNFINASWGRPSDRSGSLPDNVDEMVQVAKKLSAKHDYIRVDLYSFRNKTFFAELTPFPMAGLGKICPVEFDLYLGSLWHP